MDDLFPAEPVHATKAHTAGVSSLAGGIHTQPGTEVTLSVDGHADAEEPLDEQQGRDADVVMQDIGMQNDVANTQASEFINRRDRKVSIVQRPIVQQFKRTAKPENKVVGPKEADEENPAPKGRAGLRPKRAAAGQRGPRRS